VDCMRAAVGCVQRKQSRGLPIDTQLPRTAEAAAEAVRMLHEELQNMTGIRFQT